MNIFSLTQAHFRRHKHAARENQRYLSPTVKLARSSRTPESLFSPLPQGVRAPSIGNRFNLLQKAQLNFAAVERSFSTLSTLLRKTEIVTQT